MTRLRPEITRALCWLFGELSYEPSGEKDHRRRESQDPGYRDGAADQAHEVSGDEEARDAQATECEQGCVDALEGAVLACGVGAEVEEDGYVDDDHEPHHGEGSKACASGKQLQDRVKAQRGAGQREDHNCRRLQQGGVMRRVVAVVNKRDGAGQAALACHGLLVARDHIVEG